MRRKRRRAHPYAGGGIHLPLVGGLVGQLEALRERRAPRLTCGRLRRSSVASRTPMLTARLEPTSPFGRQFSSSTQAFASVCGERCQNVAKISVPQRLSPPEREEGHLRTMAAPVTMCGWDSNQPAELARRPLKRLSSSPRLPSALLRFRCEGRPFEFGLKTSRSNAVDPCSIASGSPKTPLTHYWEFFLGDR